MKLRYPLASQIIDFKDIQHLIEWLRANPRLTQGELVRQFEKAWAQWIGTRYSVFCNSGSSANLLMAAALLYSDKSKNKKIIVPSTGWVTTISPFIQLGFRPIMCGSDANNFGLNIEQLEKLIKRHRPAAVMAVHVLGVPASLDKLLKLQKQYGFFLLEDACAALGAEYHDKKVGYFGTMGSFSLYFGHQLSTIEGGMVNTNDKHFYDLLLMLRGHGWGKDLDPSTRRRMMQQHKLDDFHHPFTFFIPGFNLRSTDLNAYLGLRQLKKADHIVAIRRRNHAAYQKYLRGVQMQTWDREANPCTIHCVVLARHQAQRMKIVKALDRHGIETRLFTAGNLGRHPFWVKRYGKFEDPNADRFYQTGFFLPNHESLSESDVQIICQVVNSISD